MDLKEIASGVDQNTHWYYQSKKLPLFHYFKKLPDSIKYDIIDVGSGSGFFAKELLDAFPDKINVCYLIDTEYTIEEINDSLSTKLVKQTRIPDSISNSLVILMDVLEHLEDDVQMLADIKNNSIGAANYYFITVPAFQSLWSAHDVYLCHYRRYTIATLRKLLLKSQFPFESVYYLYGTLFPLVWISRKMSSWFPPKEFTSEMKPVAPLLNKILFSIARLDANYLDMNKIMGVSCVAFGKINS
jgi:hypothetical protein